MIHSVEHFSWLLFNLPNGSIWSNLIASVIWGGAAAGAALILHSRLARKLDVKFDEHKQHVETKLAEHHEIMKGYIEDRRP